MRNTGNIMVLTQWSYKDALIQTYTLPYVRIIRSIVDTSRKITLVTAENALLSLSNEEIGHINKEWSQQNMQLIALPYKRFGWRKLVGSVTQLLSLAATISKNNIKTIHAFCTPAGGIGHLLAKLTGADLIIDSYEPHAESMVENGTWKKGGMAYKILWRLEKAQTKTAKHLIATTAGMREYAKSRFGIDVKSFFVKPACVDLQKFEPDLNNDSLENSLSLNGKTICVYAGKLGGIYLTDEVFHFVKACHDRWGNDFRFLMLSNISKEELDGYIQRSGIPENVVIQKFVTHEDVPSYLSLGNFAINPVKPVPTKRYCTSIKDGEYWAMGLPVVISPDISDDSFIIEKEQIGVVVDLQDRKALHQAVDKVASLIDDQTLKKRIRGVAEKYRSYNIAQKVYQQIYNPSGR